MNAEHLSAITLSILLVLLLNAALFDLREHRVPNILVGCTLLFGITFAAFEVSKLSISDSISGALAGLLLFLPLYVIKGFGAGDVKLLAAAGSFVGPLPIFVAGAASLILGAVFAVLYYGWLRFTASRRANTSSDSVAAIETDDSLPIAKTPFAFAPFIFLSVMIVALNGYGV